MKLSYLASRMVGVVFAALLFLGVGVVSIPTAQAQRPWDRNQDRDYRRDRDRDRRDRDRDRDRDDRRDRDRDYGRDDRYRRGGGGYGNIYQVARSRGYQDGLNTGASDAQRRQSYNPQRSHYYKDATYGYDRNYGNRDAYRQAYRDGFVQGYNEGFRRYGGNNRGRNGRWFPW